MTACKLCLKDANEVGPLRESHSIPRFMLAKTRGADGKMLGLNGRGQVAVVQQDWKEPMLCDACEHLLKTEYEDFLNEILYLRRNTRMMFSDRTQVVMLGDSDRFALALLSIFWRGAVAQRDEFLWSFAPDYVLEGVRSWILAGTLRGENWSKLITVRAQEIQHALGERLDALMRPFVRQSDKQFEFVFVCGGYCLTFGLPVRPDQVYSRGRAIKPHASVIRIERIHFSKVAEIKKQIDTMLAANLPEKVQRAIQRKKGRSSR